VGRVRKESVKVRTSESPSISDDAPLDLSALHVVPHRARAHPQHFRTSRKVSSLSPIAGASDTRFLRVFPSELLIFLRSSTIPISLRVHCVFPFGSQRSSHAIHSSEDLGG
jgi:hypothetical protein